MAFALLLVLLFMPTGILGVLRSRSMNLRTSCMCFPRPAITGIISAPVWLKRQPSVGIKPGSVVLAGARLVWTGGRGLWWPCSSAVPGCCW